MKAFLLCLLASSTLAISPAFSQVTRTWVSGVGDDADPCSRTAPGKTFAGAISKTAAGGEINCIDPGGFGAVTITKSITIDGGGMQASILASGANGVIIHAGANGVVTLRNLSINGVGTGLNGIRILSAAEVNIENCVIFEFGQAGVDVNPSGACRVNLKNTIIRGCALGAIHSRPSETGNAVVTIRDCNLLASKFGFLAEDRSRAVICESELCSNQEEGLMVTVSSHLTPAEVEVNDCLITDNGGAGVRSTGKGAAVRIGTSTISYNAIGFSRASSGLIHSYGGNRLRSNTTNGSATARLPLR